MFYIFLHYWWFSLFSECYPCMRREEQHLLKGPIHVIPYLSELRIFAHLTYVIYVLYRSNFKGEHIGGWWWNSYPITLIRTLPHTSGENILQKGQFCARFIFHIHRSMWMCIVELCIPGVVVTTDPPVARTSREENISNTFPGWTLIRKRGILLMCWILSIVLLIYMAFLFGCISWNNCYICIAVWICE